MNISKEKCTNKSNQANKKQKMINMQTVAALKCGIIE